MGRKILQMLPADAGWYAKYDTPDGCFYLKVILWVSIRDHVGSEHYDHVLPIVSGDGDFPTQGDYRTDYAGAVYRPEWKDAEVWT